MLKQHILTFFLGIQKVKAVNGKPQGVNTVNCFFLVASTAVNPNNTCKCIMTLKFLILMIKFVLSNSPTEFLPVGQDR